MLIDYSQYSIDELLQAKRTIRRDVAPENYQNLLAEFEKRKLEIERLNEGRNTEEEINIGIIVKVFGYLQILGGGVFVAVLFWLLMSSGEFSAFLIFTTAGFGALSITAGWKVLKEENSGYILTLVNQFVQAFGFSYSNFLFDYRLIGDFFVKFGGETFVEFGANIGPSLRIVFEYQSDHGFVSVDFLSLFVILAVGEKMRGGGD